LKPAPRVILEEIFRASAGWHSDECVISLGKLSQYTNIEGTKLREHLRTLAALGMIERLPDVLGGKDLDKRGAHFRILVPRMAPPEKRTRSESQPGGESVANKVRALKERQFKGGSPPAAGEGQELVPAELEEHAGIMAEQLRAGRSIEELDGQFAASYRPDQWASIRSMALQSAGMGTPER
jgi:hypothetical protein